MVEELHDISLQKDKLQEDLNDWMSTAGNNTAMINTLELKVRQIAGEKRDYELLLTR